MHILPDLSTSLPLLAEGSLSIPLPLAIALFFAGLAGYALVNAIEIAVVASNRIKVRAEAEAGSRRAHALEELKRAQETFFGVIVILQNVAVFLVSTAGTVIAVDLFGNWGFLFSLVAIPLISTEFGEYTPKVIASRMAERIAFAVALPLRGLVWGMRPLISALAVVPNVLSRGGRVGPTVSEAELRMLIGIGAEEGAVMREEAELLESVFHFHDRRVNEIMIPRTEVVWLERQTTLAEFYEIFREHGHSRFPVYDGTPDNVVGTVRIKDVLRALAESGMAPGDSVEAVLRPAAFVPETKLISELLRQMQEEHHEIAVVVDEYGGVAGIVTLEMVLEEMFGEVTEDAHRQEEEFTAIDERTTRVDGGMSIFDIREELDVNLPEGEYETVAGLLLDRLGHIPASGEQVTVNGYRLTVADMRGVKIEAVLITRL